MLRAAAARLCGRQTNIRAAFSTVAYKKPEVVDPKTTYRYGLSAEQVSGVPEQMKQMLSLKNASQAEINQVQIARAIEEFQRFPGDTGSSEVQVAVLTQKILYMTDHLKQHRKDLHSTRGLIAMVNKRRKLLAYLKRKDLAKFKAVVAALNIRHR